MKPKAPKKKDIKPSAKSGEVREVNSNPSYYIMFDARKIREIKDKFYSWD